VTVTGGGSYIGGLIGGNSGTVTSCHSSGSITVAGYTEGVGGLVGGNRGSLAKCYSTVKVSGTIHVGGLAGSNGAGYVVGCYSTGGVTGDRRIGGLLGSNGGIVTGCYSTAEVKGNEEVGGCIGENAGWIISCYSAGGVCAGRTAKTVGGLVGENCGLFATIISCYSISPVTCPNPSVAAGGGLVGDNALGTITASYSLAPFDGGGPANGLCKTLTASQMTQQGAFAGFDFWGTQADGLADDWVMPHGGRPMLAWQTDSDRTLAQGAAVQVAVGNGPQSWAANERRTTWGYPALPAVGGSADTINHR
jgi:hypothetical protein